MKRNYSLLNVLTEKNYLYGKSRSCSIGYVLERNVPIEENPEKKYRLITLRKDGQMIETFFFNLEDSHLFLAPLRFVSMNLFRRYWS